METYLDLYHFSTAIAVLISLNFAEAAQTDPRSSIKFDFSRLKEIFSKAIQEIQMSFNSISLNQSDLLYKLSENRALIKLDRKLIEVEEDHIIYSTISHVSHTYISFIGIVFLIYASFRRVHDHASCAHFFFFILLVSGWMIILIDFLRKSVLLHTNKKYLCRKHGNITTLSLAIFLAIFLIPITLPFYYNLVYKGEYIDYCLFPVCCSMIVMMVSPLAMSIYFRLVFRAKIFFVKRDMLILNL